MCLGVVQHEVLGVEVDQSVEQHARRVSSKLTRFPEMFFGDAAYDQTCKTRGKEGIKSHNGHLKQLRHVGEDEMEMQTQHRHQYSDK